MKNRYKTPKIALEELVKTDVLCESKPDNGNFLYSGANRSLAPDSYREISGMADDIFAI